MGVCLTKKQAEFFKIISEYKARTGFYPGPTEAANISGKKVHNIAGLYGSLFLRGALTDGKPQTRYHADSHYRIESQRQRAENARNIRQQRVAARRPAAPVQPQTNAAQKRRIAQALVKLLSGEVDGTDAISEIASLMR